MKNTLPYAAWLTLAAAGLVTAGPDVPKWEIGPFERMDETKPVLAPVAANAWQAGGLSSPAAVVRDGKIVLIFAAAGAAPGSTPTLGIASSDNGRSFTPATAPLALGPAAKPAAPRMVATDDGRYVLTYVDRQGPAPVLKTAVSTDLAAWTDQGPAFADAATASLPPGAGAIVTQAKDSRLVAAKLNGAYWMYWGEGAIRLASSTDLAHWTPAAGGKPVLAPRELKAGVEALAPASATVTARGIVLLFNGEAKKTVTAAQAVFDAARPDFLMVRAVEPFLKPMKDFEKGADGRPAGTEAGGLVLFNGKWFLYYGAAATSIGACACDPATADKGKNAGLGKPQDADTLPRSATPPSKPAAPKKTIVVPTRTRPDGAIALTGGWRLGEGPKVKAGGDAVSRPGFDTTGWWTATVPGTVLATLIDQGVYPDPYYGLNNLAIPESLNKQDYWYRVEFPTPPAFAGRRVKLQLEGVNYRAEAWLNGASLGAVTGAFLRGDYDVTDRLAADGRNVLALHVFPPPNPGIPHEESLKAGPGPNGGQLCKDGPTFFCTEGWDWIPGIRDRCTGVWQDVVLRASGPVAIGDPRVVTDLPLPDLSPADVRIDVELANLTDQPQKGVVKASFEGVAVEQPYDLAARRTAVVTFKPDAFPALRVGNPRLWWPNGYGRPDLYNLTIEAVGADGKTSDRHASRFGIREVSYELYAQEPPPAWKTHRIEYTPTAELGLPAPAVDVRHDAVWEIGPGNTGIPTLTTGPKGSPAVRELPDDGARTPNLVIRVNGRRIFCRGGNWGLDDALKRVSREKLEPYVRLHREANLTMIRNWTGESTSRVFYDLCDEYGILVWNDFWLSTGGYNLDPVDDTVFLQNLSDTIRRFRNHPSIVLWCGRNEGVPPPALNEGIWKAVHELDGTRYYTPNSRRISLLNSGPWRYHEPAHYLPNLAKGFTTELGVPSVPEADVMRSFIPAADQWPISDTWAYHDWHTSGGGDCNLYFAAITNRYGPVSSLDEFCRKAQMVNYENHRAMFEAWNRNLWNPCSGILAWMSHPSWPSMNWQFYTWDYDVHAAYFGVRKACEPLHIQYDQPDDTVTVVNTTPSPMKGLKAVATLFDLQGKPLASVTNAVDAAENAAVTASPAPKRPAGSGKAWLLRLQLLGGADGARELARNDYWLGEASADLQALDTMPAVPLEGTLKTVLKGGKAMVRLELKNPSSTPALMTRLTLRRAVTGERVLPVYYGDNYITLLPGESRVVIMETREADARNLAVSVHGWNVNPATLQ